MAPKSAVVFALLVACSPPHYPENPVHVQFELVVDTAFTDAQVEAVAFGASDWERATEGLEITVYNAPCTQFRPAQSICVLPQHGEDMACNGTRSYIGCYTDSDRTIALDVWKLTPTNLRRTAAHEIGHAMGLSHSKAHNAMAYRIDLQTPPTCRDVEAFWKQYEVRGICRAPQ